ncbi:MAG: hypothetical protein ANIMEMIM_00058 [Candidatus Argoarchaeum ethanivorans]|uniref:Uncharacterized protein n=1 Tax=Candidatus Argoarchaeum ethanivorans TaxID=2608793 RepID=A0A811T3Q3_9EURY|nr:MAG: hypothetical protein ANIMEMIM_00058 [Candidatus Argoarchaeum ethanivorans]
MMGTLLLNETFDESTTTPTEIEEQPENTRADKIIERT